jgi:hypothetical protein
MKLNNSASIIFRKIRQHHFYTRLFSAFAPVLLAFFLTSCGVYSFTGTTISSDIQNISVANFFNNSGGGPANLSQTLTESLKEYYQRNSTLKIASPDGNADLQLEGTIVGYEVTPIAPTSPTNDQQTPLASLNRLTVRVQVKFVNTKDETQSFDSVFSAYEDFPQERTLTQVENEKIPIIFERIVFDVFNKSVANW